MCPVQPVVKLWKSGQSCSRCKKERMGKRFGWLDSVEDTKTGPEESGAIWLDGLGFCRACYYGLS